jgi:hypothetical protein
MAICALTRKAIKVSKFQRYGRKEGRRGDAQHHATGTKGTAANTPIVTFYNFEW